MSLSEIYQNMSYGPAPESSDAAFEWLTKHEQKFSLFIGGEWKAPSAGQFFPTKNPANGQTLAEVAQANATDVDLAVKAAQQAQKAWLQLGDKARARYLYALARQVQKNSRLFAVLESLDNGKPIRESRDIDVPLVARHFYHHAGWAQLREQTFPNHTAVGVVGQIIPWNFPLLMLAWKVAPALAMGNTVVLKPAESTPLTALLFAEICQQVGLPAGVFNLLTGDGSTGESLVQHKGVQKIAFTGSTEVGKIIRQATAGSGKKLSLELGGKSPFIVFEDADLDGVVEGVVDAIWFNQGQVCCAGSRLLVQESVSERLISKLKARMQKLRTGDPLDKNTDLGAINSPIQLQKIQQLVEQGKAEGGACWQAKQAVPAEGCFFPPTLFTQVSPSATIAQEEIFGPVIVSMSFRTPSEAIQLANNTRYGLAASIWTENINLALDIAPRVKAGTIWINCTNQFDAASGFGGYRESGFGREGGKEGLYEYLKPQWEEQLQKKPFVTYPQPKNKPNPKRQHPGIDRTPKLYIGGKQTRPDGGYSLKVQGADGSHLGEVGQGNRKDIRNAVEAALAGGKWSQNSGHSRAQVLYFLAENLSARQEEFGDRLRQMTGQSAGDAQQEVESALERIFSYAAWADKYEGPVHQVPSRSLTLALPEPLGVMGILCPEEFPLLGFVSTLAPALAMGNRVVIVPSERFPLSATDFYQVLDTSDVPAGAVNIVTGLRDELAKTLAQHDAVEGIWYFGSEAGSKMVEEEAAANMKRSWVSYGKYRNWLDPQQGEGEAFLRHATQVKNIWVPYGV
jgi:aldehyde dehydrogenase (NAD+)